MRLPHSCAQEERAACSKAEKTLACSHYICPAKHPQLSVWVSCKSSSGRT